MRKATPEDMIYAGLVLRLGLTTEEEMNQFTRSSEDKDASFIEIILKRGIINQEQHRAIQQLLAHAGTLPVFGTKAASGQAAQPAVDQGAIPTIVMQPGDTGATIQAPTFTDPAPAAANVPASEMPTITAGAPPSAASAPGTTKTGIGSTGNWSTLSGTLTEEDMGRVERSRKAFSDALIGAQLGGYVLLDKLGRGGMGEVYLAKQLALNRYVALKVLPKALARKPDFVERFLTEAQTLARINFPSVIQVFDVGKEGETVFFTMELVGGKTIQEMIKENQRIPVDLAINIIKQSCRALARVGREGLIHRDIKPSNIMLTGEGEVKVCDFGIATARLDKAQIKEIVGTPYYIAPEYLSGEACDSLSDQYSLGVTFHHMLGGLPKGRGGGGLIDTELPRLSDIDSSIPEEISKVVARMTELDPALRFEKFEDIFRALEDYELKSGLIEAPSEFLADRLVGMREMGWENLKKWVAVFSMVAVGFTGVTMLTHAILTRANLSSVIGWMGGVGTILIVVAYLMILYVGLARKKVLPAFGNLKRWVETHYSIALTGYFMVMVHSGNFLGIAGMKKALGVIPGLNAANWSTVPTVSFFSSFALFLVIISGLVGRFIFRELHKQLALERFGREENLSDDERQSLTRLVIGTRIMGYWRILHYPMTVFMILLVILHVISIMYYGGNFFGGR